MTTPNEKKRLPRPLPVVDDALHVRLDGQDQVLPLLTLPKRYVEWFTEGRRRAYRAILGNEGQVRTFAQHLPAVITHSPGQTFPFNCCNKGVGFLPKESCLEHYVEQFERVQRDTRDQPWRQSLATRVRAVARFYFDAEVVDYRLLTGLEIFERGTFRNLQERPLASLLFTGEGPDYLSFQLNCWVETVDSHDPRHTFVALARTMFEYDSFHISQKRFPHAYLFWISELIDKTPFQVVGEQEMVVSQRGLQWTPDALAAVSRAPEMIQEFIRSKVEDHALGRGIREITVEVVHEARDIFMTGGTE